MEKSIYIGKVKEDLLNLALYELNVNKNDIIVKEKEIKTGIFKTRKIELTIIKKKDIEENLINIIKNIIKDMSIEITNIDTYYKNNTFYINLKTDNDSLIIGRNSKNLKSLTNILIKYLKINSLDEFKFILDVSNYRKHKEKNLMFLAKNLAKEVLKNGIEVNLDPMNSYERRIVHNTLSNFKDIITESSGEEPNRYVVIKKRES
jgi:hypothetical protein CLOSPO_00927